MSSFSEFIGQKTARIQGWVGGPARLQVILVLAAVLGLDTADHGTISAVSDQLKEAFRISNTQIGALLAVGLLIAVFVSIPMGVLADRISRRMMLIVAVLGWGVAVIVSGTASTYVYLLLTQLGLGAVTAAAWPCIASLTGDFFPARERAGIYGLILSGELVGSGIGFFVSGEVSSLLGWRWGFFSIAMPSILVAWLIWRYLPEPARGGQSALQIGERNPEAATRPHREKGETDSDDKMSEVQETTLKADVEPRPELVLKEDPTRWGWWRTMRYLLRLPSYRLLIAASTFAYFSFSGIRAFAMLYFTRHYGLSRGIVSALVFVLGAGAITGLMLGGRVSERLLDRGNLQARIFVPAFAFFGSVPLLVGGFWTSNPWLGLLLLTTGVAAVSSAIAPIDAARLDILHPRLWGRGEAGRMALRSAFEGAGPLLGGALSVWLGGGDTGLSWAMLIMLVPMAAAGFFVLPGRRAYPRDVATAAASIEATAQKNKKKTAPKKK